MFIVDAHLDLAYNAVSGRDVTRPAMEQPTNENGIPTVGLPDLRAGLVGLICATIFCQPEYDQFKGYRNSDEAREQALTQLKWYQQQQDAGQLRLIRQPSELPTTTSPNLSGDSRQLAESQPPSPGISGGGQGRGPEARSSRYPKPPSQPPPEIPGEEEELILAKNAIGMSVLPAILLLEGADALRAPSDVAEWFAAGLRIVGLAWRKTRYAGGTKTPGPLTADGRAMVRELDRFGIIHDTSHLAEESFWQLLEQSSGPIIASHSNCRAIVPTDRQLSDDMIRALAQRGGVIGINFYDRFLLPPEQYGKRRANLADVATHIRHMCDLIGNANQVGIGTDMDGGLGRNEIPEEIQTSSDLPRIGEALSKAGFKDGDIDRILGENWLRFFRSHLAAG